jgi:hypothetical protein
VRNLEPLKGLTTLQELGLAIEGLPSLALGPEADISADVTGLERIQDLPSLNVLHLGGIVSQQEVARFSRYRQEKNLPAVAIND